MNLKSIRLLLSIIILVSCKPLIKIFSQTKKMNSNVATLTVHKSLEKKETKPKNIAILEEIDFVDNSDTINIPLHPYVYLMKDRVEIKKIEFTNDLEFNGYEWAYKKLNLNDSIYSLITHPEWLTHIVNFNKKGTSVSFLNTSDYSGGCVVVNKEIICNQGYGYPYNSYKKFRVKNNGYFEEVESYIPSLEKLSEKQRFNYVLNRIPELKHRDSINLLPLDEAFFQDNYNHSINLKKEKDLSNFLKIFFEESENFDLKKIENLLKKEKILNFEFLPKKTNKNYVIIPVHFFCEDLLNESLIEKILFLCYNNKGNLLDYLIETYKEMDSRQLKYVNKVILFETEYGSRNELFYEKVIFDEEKGKFKVIEN